jgi:hypothetical protein
MRRTRREREIARQLSRHIRSTNGRDPFAAALQCFIVTIWVIATFGMLIAHMAGAF